MAFVHPIAVPCLSHRAPPRASPARCSLLPASPPAHAPARRVRTVSRPAPSRFRPSRVGHPLSPGLLRDSRELQRVARPPVERSGEDDHAWDVRLRELRTFAAATGSADVPADDPRHVALYRWVCAQRHDWRRGRLSPGRFRKLCGVEGFVWDRHDAAWREAFYALAVHRDVTGSCDVQLRASDPEDTRRLARWATKQRYLARRGLLLDERRRRLAGIGFRFPNEEGCPPEFQERLQQALSVQRARGVTLADTWPEDPSLARWMQNVRGTWQAGRLPVAYRRELVRAGITCVLREDVLWEARFCALQGFVRIHGHCAVKFVEDPVLHRWLAEMKRLRAAGDLPDERFWRLHNLGFDFKHWPDVLRDRIATLAEAHETHGTFDADALEPLEAVWVRQFRALRREGRLSKKAVRELDDINFAWAALGGRLD